MQVYYSKYALQYETQSSGIGGSECSGSTLEDSLQKKCTELQEIIADRTEELRVISEQLHIVRKANLQKGDSQYDPLTTVIMVNIFYCTRLLNLVLSAIAFVIFTRYIFL